MKVLHIADLHIPALVKTIGERQAYQRSNASLNSLWHCVQKHRPKVVIIAGDIYENDHPTGLDILLFLRILIKILRTGASVLIIPGNHDTSGKETGTALDFLGPISSAYPKLHIALRRPKVVVINKVTFIMWPWGRMPTKADIKLLKKTL